MSKIIVHGLSVACTKDMRFTALDELVCEAISALEAKCARLGVDMPARFPVLEINMPCGCKAAYFDVEDVPLVDTPCPCGDPKHWLIKYLGGRER